MSDCEGCGKSNTSAVSVWCDLCRDYEARGVAHLAQRLEAERLEQRARWRRRSHR